MIPNYWIFWSLVKEDCEGAPDDWHPSPDERSIGHRPSQIYPLKRTVFPSFSGAGSGRRDEAREVSVTVHHKINGVSRNNIAVNTTSPAGDYPDSNSRGKFGNSALRCFPPSSPLLLKRIEILIGVPRNLETSSWWSRSAKIMTWQWVYFYPSSCEMVVTCEAKVWKFTYNSNSMWLRIGECEGYIAHCTWVPRPVGLVDFDSFLSPIFLFSKRRGDRPGLACLRYSDQKECWLATVVRNEGKSIQLLLPVLLRYEWWLQWCP